MHCWVTDSRSGSTRANSVERSLDMADDHTFLLPIVIDDTTEGSAQKHVDVDDAVDRGRPMS
jgi:hypothetical protein